MGVVFYLLLGWALTLTACYSCGALLMQRLRLPWTRQESLPLRFVSGAAIYSLLIFFLGIFRLYYKGVFIVLPLLLAAAAVRSGAWRLPTESLPPLPLLWRRVLWVVGIPFTVLYLTSAMAPEASADGLGYHLSFVARYYRTHAMDPIPWNIYAALSQGIELLYLSAYAVGRHSAASMVHCTFLFAAAWLMVCYARRYRMESAGCTGAILFFCSPVVGMDASVTYIDVAAAALLFTLFYVLRALEHETPGQPAATHIAALAGVLAGFAYGVKYTLFPALALAAGWTLWTWRRRSFHPLLVLSGVAAIFIAPWVMRNVIWYQNPLAPLFNNWFPNPFVHYWFEVDYRRYLSIYDLTSRWEIPLEVTVRGERLNGLLGPVFLCAPLALVALRHAEGRRLLLAALPFLATYFSNIGTRFLIPPLPFVALAIGIVFAHWRAAALAVALLHAGLSWPKVIPFYSDLYAWKLDRVPWKWALRLRSEEDYLAPRLGRAYSITRRIDELVPANARVLGVDQFPEAYCKQTMLVAYQSAEGDVLRDITMSVLAPEIWPTRLVRLRIPPTRARVLRVVTNRDDPSGRWSIHEARFYSGPTELPRAQRWRLRASSAPHQIPDAFDNSPLTRWQGDEGRKTGAYIEVDFGQPELVDTVALAMSPDQPLENMHVEAGESGGFRRLETRVEITEIPPPSGLRRAAIQELLRRNIQYLVLSDTDFEGGDIIQNREYWGVEQIAKEGKFRLYRLLPDNEYRPPKVETNEPNE